MFAWLLHFPIMAKSDEADLEHQRSSKEEIEVSLGQRVQYGTAETEKYGTMRSLIEADLFDDRYAQTKRGLNNRQVQMM